jgi:hypothetical protein
MFIPFYYIENVWCFLEISIKHNCYWIDWNIIYDKNNNEIKDKNEISLDFLQNTNALCVKDNKYCYYNNKIIYDIQEDYNVISIDGSHSLEALKSLNTKYDEFIYILQSHS